MWVWLPAVVWLLDFVAGAWFARLQLEEIATS